MNGYKAYCIFTAVKLHFNGSYDAFKYNFKTAASRPASYEGRRDRYFFEKLARIIPREEELMKYCVANAVYGSPKLWVGDMTKDHYDRLGTILETFSYRFLKELRSLESSLSDFDGKDGMNRFDGLFRSSYCSPDGAPPILSASIEAMTVIDTLVNFIPDLRKTMGDPLGMLKSTFDLVENYKPFLGRWIDISKAKTNLIKVFT